MDAYFDPTCTKDPWEELENLEKQKLEEENAVENTGENSEDSSSETETESVSEGKSSSSSTAEDEAT